MARRFLAAIRHGLLGTTASDMEVAADAPAVGSPPVTTSTEVLEVARETVAVTEAVKSVPSTQDGAQWAGAEFVVLPIGAVAVAAALAVRRSRRS